MFQFDSFAEFFAMGGHGPYVWWSYAISLLVMGYLIVAPVVRARRELNAINRQQSIARRRGQPQQSVTGNHQGYSTKL